jgi:hypothetical protein
MVKNLMKIAWIYLLGCYFASYVLLIRQPHSTAFIAIILCTYAAGLAAWFYVTIRLVIFRKKLVNFCRHIISGHYEVGIKTRPVASDEIKALADLVNKAAERLRVYDELRAEKVDMSVRVRELLYNNVREAVAIADTEEKTFQFNPFGCRRLGVREGKLTFTVLEKQPHLKAFFAVFQTVTLRDKVAREAKVTIHAPSQSGGSEFLVHIFPVKDKEEKVKAAVVLFKEASTSASGESAL